MKCFKKEQTITSFLVLFVVIASKHEKVGPTFSTYNPFNVNICIQDLKIYTNNYVSYIICFS